MAAYLLFFFLGFLAGGLFVFVYSLKTINQIHKDYRDGKYERDEEAGEIEKEER